MAIRKFLFDIDAQNRLAESIKWHESEQAIFWADVEQRKLRIWDVKKRSILDRDFPHSLTCFAFTDNKSNLLVGFENGISIYDNDTHQLTMLAQVEQNQKSTRLNEGKCDSKGRFWFGSMISDEHRSEDKSDWLVESSKSSLGSDEQAALYCARFESQMNKHDSHHVNIEQALSGLLASTCLCFSVDCTSMYHCDATSRTMYRYELDESGNIVDRFIFTEFESHTYPSGACVDKNGNIWVVFFGAPYISCFGPDGQLILRYPLPITHASSVTIGGPNMDWLLIASSVHDLSSKQLAKQPRAGAILVYELEEPLGVVETRVKLSEVL